MRCIPGGRRKHIFVWAVTWSGRGGGLMHCARQVGALVTVSICRPACSWSFFIYPIGRPVSGAIRWEGLTQSAAVRAIASRALRPIMRRIDILYAEY